MRRGGEGIWGKAMWGMEWRGGKERGWGFAVPRTKAKTYAERMGSQDIGTGLHISRRLRLSHPLRRPLSIDEAPWNRATDFLRTKLQTFPISHVIMFVRVWWKANAEIVLQEIEFIEIVDCERTGTSWRSGETPTARPLGRIRRWGRRRGSRCRQFWFPTNRDETLRGLRDLKSSFSVCTDLFGILQSDTTIRFGLNSRIFHQEATYWEFAFFCDDASWFLN